MKLYTVRAFDDGGPDFRTYWIPANDPLDARVTAFVLDKGIEASRYGRSSMIELGDVELAKTYTEIVGTPEPITD